jgi:nicotinamide mononucleotide transporter PnuC
MSRTCWMKTADMLKQIIFYGFAAVCGVGAVLAVLYLTTGYIPSILEVVGVTVNVWSITLVRKQNIFGWFAALISIFCIGVFSVRTGVYGQAFLQFGFFLPTVLYGIYVWSRKDKAHNPPVWLTGRERLMTATAIMVVFIVSWYLLPADKGYAIHFADVIGMTFVMAGFVLTALKKKDCWLVVTPGNIVIVVLFCLTGGYIIAALNVFFIINAVAGFFEWTAEDRALAKQSHVA